MKHNHSNCDHDHGTNNSALESETTVKTHKHVHAHGKDHIPADKVGIALSMLCLVHCLLGPILIVLLPGLGGLLGGELFHWLMLALVIPVAYYSFLKTYRSHGFKQAIQIGSVGVAFLILGVLIPELFHVHDHDYIETSLLSMNSLETAFTVFGGLVLAFAHYKNYQQCQCKD